MLTMRKITIASLLLVSVLAIALALTGCQQTDAQKAAAALTAPSTITEKDVTTVATTINKAFDPAAAAKNGGYDYKSIVGMVDYKALTDANLAAAVDALSQDPAATANLAAAKAAQTEWATWSKDKTNEQVMQNCFVNKQLFALSGSLRQSLIMTHSLVRLFTNVLGKSTTGQFDATMKILGTGNQVEVTNSDYGIDITYVFTKTDTGWSLTGIDKASLTAFYGKQKPQFASSTSTATVKPPTTKPPAPPAPPTPSKTTTP
jgi:PBP1b-binding outer membrane lipoprotein LpoB